MNGDTEHSEKEGSDYQATIEDLNKRLEDIEKKVDANLEKTSYCLEAIVKALQEVVSQNQTNQQIVKSISNIDQNQMRTLNRVNDSVIVANNIGTSIDDFKNDLNAISDKVDAVDYSIKNLRIYKYYSSDDI